jgi:hypothetical protein
VKLKDGEALERQSGWGAGVVRLACRGIVRGPAVSVRIGIPSATEG